MTGYERFLSYIGGTTKLDAIRLEGKFLLWSDDYAIGYYPVSETPYDENYFHKYESYEKEGTNPINEARINLLRQFVNPRETTLDIGIGCGTFLNGMVKVGHAGTLGTDINPFAVEYLNSKYRMWDGETTVDAMTFWDSLEHIHDFSPLLEKVTKYVFVSCPIYQSIDHVLSSKHLRLDEHCHYWGATGLIRVMSKHDFELVYSDQMESRLGREDIISFVFRRRQ